MEGGTTFHFVTDGMHAALEQAMPAANGKDVRAGGGVAKLRRYRMFMKLPQKSPLRVTQRGHTAAAR